jgi:hypothetical protein
VDGRGHVRNRPGEPDDSVLGFAAARRGVVVVSVSVSMYGLDRCEASFHRGRVVRPALRSATSVRSQGWASVGSRPMAGASVAATVAITGRRAVGTIAAADAVAAHRDGPRSRRQADRTSSRAICRRRPGRRLRCGPRPCRCKRAGRQGTTGCDSRAEHAVSLGPDHCRTCRFADVAWSVALGEVLAVR